nr:DUF1566 domain-containing protein [Halomonas campisalis]
MDSEYTFPGSGLVGDPAQELIWMRCSLDQRYAEGRCHGEAGRFSWRAVQAQVDALSSAECPWRLPRFHELRGLLQPGASGGMAIDSEAFPDTPEGWFWNQVSAGGHSQHDCFVDFTGEGRTRCNMGGDFYLRLVMPASAATPACTPQ